MINGIMIGIPLTKKVKGKPDKLIMPIAHYSAAGKTNSDSDRAILKDLTGNGHDLTLLNFAFTSESGYDGSGGLVFDGVDDWGANCNMPILKDYTIIFNIKHGKNTNDAYGAAISSRILGNSFLQTPFIYGKIIVLRNKPVNLVINFGDITDISSFNLHDGITYMTSKILDGKIKLKNGGSYGSNRFALGSLMPYNCNSANEFANMTFYEAYLFDKTLSEDEINYYKSLM